MKILESKIEDAGWRGRSVLDCGSPLPLLNLTRARTYSESARGLAQSKTWRRFLALLGFIILHSSFCLRTQGQSYSIDWSTIDGGGGTSTGGVYSVSGTIGQPDAGAVMTGGSFSVNGGFWALPTAVQTTNAPTLTIAPATPGNATISWTPNTPGFVLQETWSLSLVNWTNSPSGAANPISVPATLPTKFYRLFKP